jgi:acetyl esterase/lipase
VIDDVRNTSVKGFWIGDKEKSTKHLVYFHGGGFVLPLLDPHIDMLQRIVKWSGNTIAVFVPCYTLSPGARYPQAIKECAEAVKFVDGLGKDVLLGGDSAGGNLVAAIFSLLAGHAPNGVQTLSLSRPVKGAFLIAPWVSSDDTKFPEMHKLASFDIIDHKIAQYWNSTYRGQQENDVYTEAERAEASWWEPLKGKAGDVLILSGSHEVLRPAIDSFAKKFEDGFGKGSVKYVVGKGEVHDAPLNTNVLTLDTVGEGESQEGALKRWIEGLSK